MRISVWVIASLIVSHFLQVLLAQAPAVRLVTDKATCTTSQINYIRCQIYQSTSQPDTTYVSDLQLRWEDGKQQTLCVNSRARRRARAQRSSISIASSSSSSITYQAISLSAGDAFYGIRACYDDSLSHVTGLMFAAGSGQYVCGNIWKSPKLCITSKTLVNAPLSHITAKCNGRSFVGVEEVCWNKYYIPQQLSYVCPAGQGSRQGVPRCQQCPVDYFNLGGLSACASCPQSQVAASTGSSLCGCSAGYGFDHHTQQCQQCPQGTYSPGGALNPCIKCPYPFMASLQGSTAIKACLCQAGYGYSIAVRGCTPCAQGKYNDGRPNSSFVSPGVPTFQPCSVCPSGTTTATPQAISVNECI